MTTHHEEDNALDALLQVADVRTELALQKSLRLNAGLMSIVTSEIEAEETRAAPDIDIASTPSPPAENAEHNGSRGQLALSTATTLLATAGDTSLSEAEIRLLAQIASGVTADVAARKLGLSARTLRRQLRTICDRLNVNTPIEAVVWAARQSLI